MGYIETLTVGGREIGNPGFFNTSVEVFLDRQRAGVCNRRFLNALWKTYPEKKPEKFQRSAGRPAFTDPTYQPQPVEQNDEGMEERRKQALSAVQGLNTGGPMSREVIKAVALWFGLKPADLIGKRRASYIVSARFVAMKLLCDQIGANGERRFSYPHIGSFFGGRDHSTVIHAMNTFGTRSRVYPEMLEAYEALKVAA